MPKEIPPVKDFEDFKKRVLALDPEQQVKVLKLAFDLVYSKLDESIWRTMATAIKYAKDAELEGHENFQIDKKELKKLSHIQDGFRKKK